MASLCKNEDTEDLGHHFLYYVKNGWFLLHVYHHFFCILPLCLSLTATRGSLRGLLLQSPRHDEATAVVRHDRGGRVGAE